ncbi:hypothetical protein [uncultured Cetobacterium sp.]|uniref:hypothetical protein n=1 Tax=uncultured Cetobacterium sp. TaxID=527638 RepID=UPI00262A40F5|nr:hypothetical protein [uncultured Cetobacterium sp.]
MARKNVNLDVINSIGTEAAHKKNDENLSLDKSKTKTKTIVLPEFWEVELFNNKVKNKTFSGTWQSFIRDAVREKLILSGIDIDNL